LGQSKDIHRLKEALYVLYQKILSLYRELMRVKANREEWQEDPDLEIPEALQLSEGDFQLAKDLTVVLQVRFRFLSALSASSPSSRQLIFPSLFLLSIVASL